MAPNDTPAVAPRGTDRVRRRADQAAHAKQAVDEAAKLTPPRGEEKTRQIAENKAKELARFGESGTTRRKTLQAEHREQALAQDARPTQSPLQLAKLVPGQQVDHRTARLLAKAADKEARDEISDAARAAGRAVHTTLSGKVAGNPRSVFRRVAAHNAKA